MSDGAVEWLLTSDEPAVRALARRDLLGQDPGEDDAEVLAGAKVSALLETIVPGESRGGWTGSLWGLLSLIDLGAPIEDEPRADAGYQHYVGRVLQRPQHRGHPTVINGLHRFCANVEGHALIIGCGLGRAGDDPRLTYLAEKLIEWQWPDGGWNCHRNASGRRSSFHESIAPMLGLHEYALATGDQDAGAAAGRTAELFLDHRLIFSLGTGQPSRFRPKPPPAGRMINERWGKLGYPSYWHYDVLVALRYLARMGRAADPRTADGLDLLEQKRRPDGRWAADRQWWVSPGHRFANQVEAVDWGAARQPSELITFHALRILRSSGRVTEIDLTRNG